MSKLSKSEETAQPTPPEAGWLDSWHVNPSSNTEYGLIDGLRGIAILLVIVCHFFYINPNSGRALHFVGGFLGASGVGVYIFFGLSGFLISWPFWKQKLRGVGSAVPPGYAWRRFWKIYPPLAASVIVLTPFYILQTKDWSYVRIAAQWVAGLAFFVPPSGKFNPVMWSLVVEIQFYVVIPLAFILVRRVTIKNSLWIITGCFLVIPNAFRFMAYDGVGPVYWPNIDAHFPSGLDFFSLGILLAGLKSMMLIPKRWARFGNIGFLLLFLWLIQSGWLAVHPTNLKWGEISRWTIIIATALMLCLLADPQYPVSQWLCFSPLRWFGLISYELYLVHQTIILSARSYFGAGHGSAARYVALLGGCFVISVTIAALFYRYFSLPILKSGRRLQG